MKYLKDNWKLFLIVAGVSGLTAWFFDYQKKKTDVVTDETPADETTPTDDGSGGGGGGVSDGSITDNGVIPNTTPTDDGSAYWKMRYYNAPKPKNKPLPANLVVNNSVVRTGNGVIYNAPKPQAPQAPIGSGQAHIGSGSENKLTVSNITKHSATGVKPNINLAI